MLVIPISLGQIMGILIKIDLGYSMHSHSGSSGGGDVGGGERSLPRILVLLKRVSRHGGRSERSIAMQ